jgi:sugar/nucleoside kinase (ribokinase family)
MSVSDGRWDVIGIGENSVDSVNLLPGYPQPTGPAAKMRIRERHVLCGGQMATAMCACASLGLRAKYVGVTGTDDNGRRIRAELQGLNVDISDLVIRDVENRFAVILVDENTGDRMVLWDRDDRLRLRESELPVDALARTSVVHVDDVDDEVAIRAARLAREAGAIVTSDIDRLTPRTEELAAIVSHAIFAQHVPLALTGLTDIEAALRRMRQTLDNVLVVTMGEQGSSALVGDRFFHEPAFLVHAVDTTGAGDVFRGGFIYALVDGQPMDQALRTANAAAAVSCTRLGALNGVPTLNEVQELMAANVLR